MTDEIVNFAQAAKKNEYAEYEIEESYVLISNREADKAFIPWVILPEEFDEEETVLKNQIKKETEGVMKFDKIEKPKGEQFAMIHGAEIEV